MADVLSNYRVGDAFDEMIDAEGSVRPSYKAVYSALSSSTSDDLRMIAESLANNYTQAGVTFDVGGVERPFPLDLVPRVIASPEWEIIEAGVAQRVRALEAFLSDIYFDARVIADGVIPSQLLTSSTHFHRAVWGIQPSNGVRIHVAGIDLIRNRGQRPGAERGLLRHDQPQRHAHCHAGGLRQPAHPSGHRLPNPAADSAAQGSAARCRGTDRGGPYSRRLLPCLL